MNKAELELHADQSKKALYAEKEELFFAMDEKSHDADLTEKGRSYLRPEDPEGFVLPDLTTRFHEIDTGTETDPRKRLEAKAKVQAEFEAKAVQIHTTVSAWAGVSTPMRWKITRASRKISGPVPKLRVIHWRCC